MTVKKSPGTSTRQKSQKSKARSGKITKAQLAYAQIRKRLVSGDLELQKRLSLRSLARHLDMSVVPVSEAVRRLEQEGLVEVQPQSGIYIRPLSDRQRMDLTIVRQALEVQAARIIASRKNTQGISRLREIARELLEHVKANETAEAAYSDWEFHQELVRMAGCEILQNQYDQISTRAMVCTLSPGTVWTEEGHSNHMALVDALASNDPDKAGAAIRKHLKVEEAFLEAEQ